MRSLALLLVLLTTLVSHANTIVRFTLPYGTMDVELYDEDKPITVTNFVSYIDRGEYTNMIIHRWAEATQLAQGLPGFVIQGGGFAVTNRPNTTPAIIPIPTHGTIFNEYSVGPRYSNVYGTIAMARSSGVNSATSQFFFNLKDNSFLDDFNGGFTVFGRVISGFETLNRFMYFDSVNGPWIGDGDGPNSTVLNELPVQTPPQIATFEDLLYCKIEILKRHQKITFPAIGPRTYGDAPIPLVAGSNVQLPVSFEVVSGPAFITEGKLALSGAGTVTVKAFNAGSPTHTAASVTQSFAVAKASQEITFEPVPDQLLSAGSVALTYSAPARLPVTLTVVEGPVTISNRAAVFTGALGKVTLKASQPGNANYLPAPDVQRSFEILGAVSLTAGPGGTVSKSPDQSSYTNLTSVTLTATPNPGHAFVRWTGDVTGTSNVVTVSLASNVTAHAEFRAADLVPGRLSIIGYANNQFTVRLEGSPASRWELQRSTNLTNWVVLKSGTTESGNINLIDEAAPATGAFYRVRQTPQ